MAATVGFIAVGLTMTGCVSKPAPAPTSASSGFSAEQTDGTGHAAATSVAPLLTPWGAIPPVSTPGNQPEAGPGAAGPGQPPAETRSIALLIGDSQSAGAANVPGNRTWPQSALRTAGYDVQFVGAGGIGFVISNKAGSLNFPSALKENQWDLPVEPPALIVLEGGGNDATKGASDTKILRGVKSTFSSLRERYPTSEILLVGALAGPSSASRARRVAVNELLGKFARQNNVRFVDVGGWLSKYDLSEKMASRAHLTQAGHDVLASVFAARLGELHLTHGDIGAVDPLSLAQLRSPDLSPIMPKPPL